MRRAPNGDIFVAETNGGAAGAVKIFRGMTADGKPQQTSVFANLPNAFGINFYPPGPTPQWVYVSNTDHAGSVSLQEWRSEGYRSG